jgi:arylsulfatase A
MNFSNFFIFPIQLRFGPRLSYFVILVSFVGFYSCQKIEPADTSDHLSASETDKVRRDGPPNIVLVLGDDIGYEIPTINGGQSYSTPNIDLLAQQGARFTQCYASATCTPARIMLLTGKYNFRNYTAWGVLQRTNRTMGNMFKDAGYATCYVGKWQLDGGDTSIRTFGFDNYEVWLPYVLKPEDAGGTRYKSPPLYTNGNFLPSSETQNLYSVDLFTDYAVNFMRTNQQNPFFLYYATPLCHKQISPTRDDPEYATWDYTRSRSKFFPNMVKYMDKDLGRLRDSIRSLGLENNTIFIYLGDNGTPGEITSKFNGTNIQGDKGKTTTYGTHVPLIITWPGHITPGMVTNQLVAFPDFVPTLSEITGVSFSQLGITDGMSFNAVLNGASSSSRDYIFNHYRPLIAKSNKIPIRYVQDSVYKLYDDKRFYNMSLDVYEQHSLNTDSLTLAEQSKRQYFLQILSQMHN